MRRSLHPSSRNRALAGTLLGLGTLVAFLCESSVAMAQGFGPDPFKPYNSRYEPFVYPVAPGPLDYGYNQGFSPMDRGVRGANQFEEYLNSLRGGGPDSGRSGRGGGAGTPYFRSNRTFDRDFDRIYQYRPNREADEKFDAQQEGLSTLYFRYLREKDPRKRGELLREYNKARNQADRDLSTAPGSRTRGTAKSRRASGPPSLDETPSSSGLGAAPSPSLRSRSSRPVRSRLDATNPAAGPAPSPGEDESGSGADRRASPTRVLDRALRTGPPARAASPRGAAPSGLGSAPPPRSRPRLVSVTGGG